MHARADAPSETAASWPEEIFAILQRFDVRQVPYVPDAGHSLLIQRVLGSSTMRGVSLTTEEEGVALLAASHPEEVREVVEAGAMQAYNACTPTAVLLSQRLIGTKVFTK